MRNTTKEIHRICERRGVPKIKKGTRCEVDGTPGKIWGGNSSGNFNVKRDDCGTVVNCHPGWKMKIMADDGEVIYQSEDA